MEEVYKRNVWRRVLGEGETGGEEREEEKRKRGQNGERECEEQLLPTRS